MCEIINDKLQSFSMRDEEFEVLKTDNRSDIWM